MKYISILGSTGSIGTQTLDVVRSLNLNGVCISISGMSTNTNIKLLCDQIKEFKPLKVCVTDDKSYDEMSRNISKLDLDYNIEILYGLEGLVSIATIDNIEVVVNALVGNIGLIPTIEAIKNGKHIALANKETLVTSGEIVMKLAKENNVNIYPVDSEHSAIYQCLQGNYDNKVEKLYLTASGGPFRDKDLSFIEKSTLKDALNHPNWKMGNKITIDSATMMNKGLEVIEAKWLFDIDVEDIKILVHPQSIIHSMVEFEDSAVIAQLGMPDMKVPIQYALTYPKRIKNKYEKIDFIKNNNLTFREPDFKIFRCLQLAYDAIQIGGIMPTVLNGANEVVVTKFLQGKVKFTEIPNIIEMAMKKYNLSNSLNLENVLNADKWARDFVNDRIL